MSRTRVHNFAISLDGFGTGEGQTRDLHFGHAGDRLHEWMFATKWWARKKPGGSGGVDDAFARLFEQYHTPVLNYLHRMVNDRALAEDLTQDAFIKAYNALPRTNADLAFKAWLYRIATNTAISHLRRGKIVKFLPFLTDRESADEAVERSVTRQADIGVALAKLPKHYAAALLLRHYQGLSLAETAAEKMEALTQAGVHVVKSPADMGKKMREALGR